MFLEGKTTGRFTEPLTPVVSDVIYDKKAMSDLTICRLSDCSAPVSGGKNIIMLCEKVVKEDIRVRFYEMQNNGLVWEGNGEFTHTDVHKQVAISFRTPQYRTQDITEPVTVSLMTMKLWSATVNLLLLVLRYRYSCGWKDHRTTRARSRWSS